jgi:hypothetical protein
MAPAVLAVLEVLVDLEVEALFLVATAVLLAIQTARVVLAQVVPTAPAALVTRTALTARVLAIRTVLVTLALVTPTVPAALVAKL